MKRKVWFSPVPGIGERAVLLGKGLFGGVKILSRDKMTGRCYRATVSPQSVSPR